MTPVWRVVTLAVTGLTFAGLAAHDLFAGRHVAAVAEAVLALATIPAARWETGVPA